MNQNIFFIAGIHGVGKTTLCNYLSETLQIKHYSASNLIKEYAQIELSNHKQVKDISKNQDILICAMNELLKSYDHIILDGHFCLLNDNNKINRIPTSTYIQMNPKGIVCLFDEIERIHERLENRDRYDYDKHLLNELQEEEKVFSKEIAYQLGIPYFLGNTANDREKIYSFIDTLIKGPSL